MSFFDNLGDKLQSTGKDIANKAKDLAEITKLNAKVASEQDKLKEAYRTIGEKYYEAHAELPDPEFVEYFEAITAAKEAIAAAKDEIAEIKGVKLCTTCGAEMSKEAMFCSSCGNKYEPKEEPAPEETEEETPEDAKKVCPICQAEVMDDAMFCPACGAKLAE